MSVSSTTNRVSYSGDGATTTFAFGYYFLEQADLTVSSIDDDGNVVEYVLNTDYTITGTQAGNGTYPSGGSVVFGTAPVVGLTLEIVRSPSPTQTTEWVDGDPDPAAVKETAFDKLTLLVQRLFDLVARVPTLPDAVAEAFSGLLPTVLTAGYALAVNAAGNGWTLVDIGQTSTAISSISEATTLSANVGTYFCSTSGGAYAVTLPAAESSTGWLVRIKNTTLGGSNSLTVSPEGDDEIEGGASATVAPGDFLVLQCDGTAYWQVG